MEQTTQPPDGASSRCNCLTLAAQNDQKKTKKTTQRLNCSNSHDFAQEIMGLGFLLHKVGPAVVRAPNQRGRQRRAVWRPGNTRWICSVAPGTFAEDASTALATIFLARLSTCRRRPRATSSHGPHISRIDLSKGQHKPESVSGGGPCGVACVGNVGWAFKEPRILCVVTCSQTVTVVLGHKARVGKRVVHVFLHVLVLVPPAALTELVATTLFRQDATPVLCGKHASAIFGCIQVGVKGRRQKPATSFGPHLVVFQKCTRHRSIKGAVGLLVQAGHQSPATAIRRHVAVRFVSALSILERVRSVLEGEAKGLARLHELQAACTLELARAVHHARGTVAAVRVRRAETALARKARAATVHVFFVLVLAAILAKVVKQGLVGRADKVCLDRAHEDFVDGNLG
eukprot:m.481869 g.481869  ORF g.481869 m.481869 type:complete len:401 (+) comp22352_c0_seq1:158-1360(+)